ncbi:MAG: hypothetical protein JXX14_20065 [Deltaproteobacteria bacterium]|nr:hypothetical protein [Deltaproteobacteria bacterium]
MKPVGTDNSATYDSAMRDTVSSDTGSLADSSSATDTGAVLETDSATMTAGDSDSNSADTGTADGDTGVDSGAEATETEDTGSVTDADSGTGDVPSDSGTEDSDTGSDSGSDTGEEQTCDSIAGTPQSGYRTLDVGGVSRRYFLHVPAAYNGSQPAPLILDFHVLGDNGQNYSASGSIFPAVTDSEGVIMAFPDGEQGPSGSGWNIGPCCVYQGDVVDDVAFARQIVEDVASQACLDAKRVYATGAIIGGGLAYRLACDAADVFAAVASASFDLIQETVDDCHPSRAISVASFRDYNDPFVQYGGNYSTLVTGQSITFIGAEATFSKWAELNGCSGVPADIGNECRLYADTQCSNGTEVMLCTQWTAMGLHYGDAAAAWEFFKRHSLP